MNTWSSDFTFSWPIRINIINCPLDWQFFVSDNYLFWIKDFYFFIPRQSSWVAFCNKWVSLTICVFGQFIAFFCQNRISRSCPLTSSRSPGLVTISLFNKIVAMTILFTIKVVAKKRTILTTNYRLPGEFNRLLNWQNIKLFSGIFVIVRNCPRNGPFFAMQLISFSNIDCYVLVNTRVVIKSSG